MYIFILFFLGISCVQSQNDSTQLVQVLRNFTDIYASWYKGIVSDKYYYTNALRMSQFSLIKNYMVNMIKTLSALDDHLSESLSYINNTLSINSTEHLQVLVKAIDNVNNTIYQSALLTNAALFNISTSVSSSLVNSSLTPDIIEQLVNAILYGKNHTTAYTSTGGFFDGLIGALADMLQFVFKILINDVVVPVVETLMKTFFVIFGDSLKVLFDALIKVLNDLLPEVESLVDLLFKFFKYLVKLTKLFYEFLDSRIYFTELFALFVILYLKFQNFPLCFGIVFFVSFFIDLSKK